MFTFYFIIGFLFFCCFILFALDHLTLLDYNKQIRNKRQEIKELMSAHSTMTERMEANRLMGKITRLNREVEQLSNDMIMFRPFLHR